MNINQSREFDAQVECNINKSSVELDKHSGPSHMVSENGEIIKRKGSFGDGMFTDNDNPGYGEKYKN